MTSVIVPETGGRISCRPEDAVDHDSDSLEARIAREHRQLAPLFDATRRALQAGEAGGALRALASLQRAVETHTAQEDQLYYPALWSLCPERKKALELFIRSHARFREELEETAECLERGDLQAATSHFDGFHRSFSVHEVYEEELLRAIDAESPWADSAPS